MDCTPTHSFLEDSDILPVVHAARLNHVSYTNQCDIGSNINVTAQLDLLDEYVPLVNSFDLLGADASVDKMLCLGYGYYTMVFANGTTERLKMYYCPQISETLISPQAMCADASITFSGFDIHCQDLNNPYVRFHSPSGLYTADAPLTRSNNLFYFTQLFHTPTAHRLNSLLTTELWHQRLGHPGMHQLRKLQDCATGIPSGLHKHVHPLHNCKVCTDAQARKPPMGRTSDVTDLLPGSRFHIDFGYMRVSSEDYVKRHQATRVIQSYDGFNSYLIISDAKSRYTWIFLTSSKSPPVDILCEFLAKQGLKDSYRAIRVDQGGELWRSNELCKVVLEAKYVMEPTGNDSPNQNGKVERLNGTFGIMVRSLLYSSSLPPKYWSSALLHAVHLKNRLWHSAIDQTPYGAWTGNKPDLSHLRVFGSLLSPRQNGHRPAKLDKHTYDGIFLGYPSTTNNAWYIDINTGRVKNATTPSVFDEAHYSSTNRPPGPQFLFDLGLKSALPDELPVPTIVPCAPAPPIAAIKPSPLPPLACISPLPLGELNPFSIAHIFDTPATTTIAAAASLAAPEVMSIELSGDPLGPCFDESIPIGGLHVLAGLHITYDDARGQLQLLSIEKGTPAARIPRWRTRLRHAYILGINNVDIATTADLTQAISVLRSNGDITCNLRLTFDDVKNTLSVSGLPQLYFDQLRDIRRIN